MKCKKLYTFFEHGHGVAARIPASIIHNFQIEQGHLFLPEEYNKKKEYPERTIVIVTDAKYILTESNKRR